MTYIPKGGNRVKTSVNVDPEIFEKGKAMGLNFSRLLEHAIKEKVGFKFELRGVNEGDHIIYFISDTAETYVKIGITKKLGNRVSMLQVGNPDKLKLLGTIKGTPETEYILHQICYPEKIRGEWFYLTHKVKGLISDLLQQSPEQEVEDGTA